MNLLILMMDSVNMLRSIMIVMEIYYQNVKTQILVLQMIMETDVLNIIQILNGVVIMIPQLLTH